MSNTHGTDRFWVQMSEPVKSVANCYHIKSENEESINVFIAHTFTYLHTKHTTTNTEDRQRHQSKTCNISSDFKEAKNDKYLFSLTKDNKIIILVSHFLFAAYIQAMLFKTSLPNEQKRMTKSSVSESTLHSLPKPSYRLTGFPICAVSRHPPSASRNCMFTTAMRIIILYNYSFNHEEHCAAASEAITDVPRNIKLHFVFERRLC